MTYRLFASALIITLFAFLGLCYYRAEKKSVLQIMALITFFEHQKHGVERRMELFDIIDSFENKALCDCGFLLALKTRASVEEKFKAASKTLDITPEAKLIISDFGKSVTLLQKEELVQKIDESIDFLNDEYKKKKEASEKKGKSAGAVVALLGVLIVIIFF